MLCNKRSKMKMERFSINYGTKARVQHMLHNQEISEYENLLQRQQDGDILSTPERDRLQYLATKAEGKPAATTTSGPE